MNEVLVVDNLEFEVRRSARRKTLGLTVDRAGELVVHSTESANQAELRKWVGQKLLWVHQKLLRKEAFSPAARRLEVVSGESIAYLGQNYRLRIVTRQDSPLLFDGQWFLLREKDRSDAPKLFQAWYQDVGGEWLHGRVRHWEPKVGKTASRILVCDLGFRWGSCGKNDVLRFHWRLLQLPIYLVDYVIAHELVHLHERNHTPAFWQTLERFLPDWKERKDTLAHQRAEMLWSSEGDAGRGAGATVRKTQKSATVRECPGVNSA